MDYLRAGIGLRAMGQGPTSEYQREAYDMFTEMVESVKRDAVRYPSAPSWPSPRPSHKGSSLVQSGPSRQRRRSRTRSGATIPARAVLARSTSAATALRSAIVSSEA